MLFFKTKLIPDDFSPFSNLIVEVAVEAEGLTAGGTEDWRSGCEERGEGV
jgi:hypothetical protein